MRGVYSATIDINTLESPKTLIYLETPNNMCIEILSASVTNRTLNTNQQIEIAIMKGQIANCASGTGTGSGSGSGIGSGSGYPNCPIGTTIIPVPTEDYSGDTNLSIIIGDITDNEPVYDSIIDKEGCSVLLGYHYDPVPECRPIIGPSKILGLVLTAELLTAFDSTIKIIYREIG